jgi:hypothetical protein
MLAAAIAPHHCFGSVNGMHDNWPALPLDAWEDTYHTLHMWSQIAGKICLALTTPVNHFWNITFHITSRGLSTPLLRYRDGALTMAFDFIDHQFVMTSSDGSVRTIALSPRTVADFYREVMSALRDLGVEVRIWTMPVEYPNPIRFEEDVQNASYDKEYANRLWQILLAAAPVFLEFLGQLRPRRDAVQRPPRAGAARRGFHHP